MRSACITIAAGAIASMVSPVIARDGASATRTAGTCYVTGRDIGCTDVLYVHHAGRTSWEVTGVGGLSWRFEGASDSQPEAQVYILDIDRVVLDGHLQLPASGRCVASVDAPGLHMHALVCVALVEKRVFTLDFRPDGSVTRFVEPPKVSQTSSEPPVPTR